MESYRVFLAYSSEDVDIRQRIVEHLKSIGAKPIWDEEFDVGLPFPDQIKEKIRFAHIFMPILTNSISETPWIHQEIGFANALNIPVVPLAIGKLPEALINAIHAVRLSRNPDRPELEQALSAQVLSRVVERAVSELPGAFERADFALERTSVLVKYASLVAASGDSAKVRHWGVFSTFSLPKEDIGHQFWDDREGDSKRSPEARIQLREERVKFEKLASAHGSDFIIYPTANLKHLPAKAKFARLESLYRYLESADGVNIRAIITCPKRVRGSLHIVGDWFFAESVSGRPDGFRQTTFTRHAPTVIRRAREFDLVFEELHATYVRDGKSSRQITMEKIKHAIKTQSLDSLTGTCQEGRAAD